MTWTREEKRKYDAAWKREHRKDPAFRASERAIRKAYYERNKNKIVARQIAYSKTEAGKATNRRHYLNHQEKRLAYQRVYRLAHLEQANKAVRDWRERNKEKINILRRAYYQRKPEKFVDARGRRAARLRDGFSIAFTNEQLVQRLSMYGHKCWMCGGTATEIDHVIPLARANKPGPHILANFRPACRSCNARKGANYGV